MLIVAGAGAVVICAVSMFVLAYFVQRPMVELQEKMELVSKGNLNVAVSFSQRNDEIGDLGRNFNHMMQQLRDSRRRNRAPASHANVSRRAPGDSRRVGNGLGPRDSQPACRNRRGHRDRRPRSARDQSARAVVKDVRLEITRISRTLTDLLETARPRRPEVRRSNLNTTVEHAVMLARQQVLSKPIKIELQKAPDLPEVEHDSDQIHQVLLNLLLNAVQAMEKAGTVRVEIGSRQGYASVVVQRHWSWHLPSEFTEHFPAFLYHQGHRHGPWSFSCPPYRGRSSWPDRSQQCCGNRQPVHSLAALPHAHTPHRRRILELRSTLPGTEAIPSHS